jgi:hypothetical protein
MSQTKNRSMLNIFSLLKSRNPTPLFCVIDYQLFVFFPGTVAVGIADKKVLFKTPL